MQRPVARSRMRRSLGPEGKVSMEAVMKQANGCEGGKCKVSDVGCKG
jgi:hypothetical protein